MLGQGLRQGIGIGVAGSAEQLTLDGGAVENRAVDLLGGPRQGRESLFDGLAVT